MFRRAPRDSHGREPLLHGSNITLPDVRSEGLNEPCRRLWTAALRAGWLNLGHDESEVLAGRPAPWAAVRLASGRRQREWSVFG
jgi:hypothetical protein